MAVEKVFNEILNEPRYGSFSLTIIEGDSPQQTSAVPAIEMVHFGDEDEYIKKQRNKWPVPVLAFRSGGRGWCNVVVDERLIEVETVKLSIPGDRVNIFQEPMFKSVIKTTTIPPERFYKLYSCHQVFGECKMN